MYDWKRIDKDDEFLRTALSESDPVVLRALLHQLGDTSFDALELVGSDMGPLAGPPTFREQSDAERIRDRMLDYLRRNRDGDFEFPEPPVSDRAEMHRMVDLITGQNVPEDELDFWLQEASLEPMMREVDWGTVPLEERRKLKVAVIGAGISGTYMAIQLRRAGVSFEVIEKNDSPGGTWYENTYPGIRIDTPTKTYSYSFEPYYPWRHRFAPQRELIKYINYVVDKYDVRDSIRLNTEVTGARWNDEDKLWNIDVVTAEGATERLRVNAIVSAVGLLNRPKTPDIEGVDTFEGTIMHTARWDHSVELDGKRVASIGTGSSGMQLAPDLAPLVGHLTIFQRSAGWVVHTPGYRDELSEYTFWLAQNLPYYANWERVRVSHLYGEDNALPTYEVDPDWSGDPRSVSKVNDLMRVAWSSYIEQKVGHRPDLLAKATPVYPPMSKRIVRDNGWFDCLLRDDVDLVTDAIERITPKGILLKNGQELEFDVIVFASGFRASDFLHPMEIVGRHGMGLNEFWSKDGARAYLGMTVPHFPNLWMLYGPNTNPKSGNPIIMVESVSRYVVGSLKALVEEHLASLEVREDVFDSYQEKLDKALSTGVWLDKRQSSYYRNDKYGRVDVMTPWGATSFWKWTTKPNLDEFEIEPLVG